jgi:hypothetical protein
MIQPRYPRLSAFGISPVTGRKLSTGNGFGGSNLKISRREELVFSIVSSSVLISDCTPAIVIERSSPLVIEVGKIVVLACWFWCLIGANFCVDSISAIVAARTQDI